MKALSELIRPNIQQLAPYSCARDEFEGEASIYLDANENPYHEGWNRYPDPMQWSLKRLIADQKGVDVEQIFLGNGSDESIDLAFRAFCEPACDNVVAIDPTYGMYRVCADINHVAYRPVKLHNDYDFKAEELLAACDDHTKLIFLCSPNNPTGNNLSRGEIVKLLNRFQGIVAIDEAYIDFSAQPSFLTELNNYPNMLVFQTFSKAWGSAALRLGMAFASKEIIAVYNKIKYPYNINLLTQQQIRSLLEQPAIVSDWVRKICSERERLRVELQSLNLVKEVYPSDANFLLVKTIDANSLYKRLVSESIVVRNRHKVSLCENCLRITIGTPQENQTLLSLLKQWDKECNKP